MSKYVQPDQTGHFGVYGGRFVPETLMHAITELLEEVYEQAKQDTPEFQKQLDYYLTKYIGRETPLYFAERLTELGGAKNLFET